MGKSCACNKKTTKTGKKGVLDGLGNEFFRNTGIRRQDAEKVIQKLQTYGKTIGENKNTEGAIPNLDPATDEATGAPKTPPQCFDSWAQFLNTLVPEDLILTKEDFSLIQSFLNVKEFSTHKNIVEYFCQESIDPCNIEKFLKFIVVRKIGSPLLTYKQNRFSAYLQTHNNYTSAINSYTSALATLAGTFQIFPEIDAKQAIIGLLLEAQLTQALLKLDAIDILIRLNAENDEFCLTACSEECSPPKIAPSAVKSEAQIKIDEVREKALAFMLRIIEKEVTVLEGRTKEEYESLLKSCLAKPP